MKIAVGEMTSAAQRFCFLRSRAITCLGALFILMVLVSGETWASSQWPQVALSKDGTPISYELTGTGEPTLVFVHGWSCDSRYWRAQVPFFSARHRVITLDLAGHGHSGLSRTTYSMQAFGEDVKTVVEATASGQVILIGHSMGGAVIAEAARLMPERVRGLIGVDTFDNIEYPLTAAELKEMTAPLEKNFPSGCRAFVQQMLYPQTDQGLREWILADVAAAPPGVAISAMQEMMSQYITGDAAKLFDQIRKPVICVNGDLWPVNTEANRRHMYSFDVIVLKKADHFLMLDQPAAFNRALEKAIGRLNDAASAKKLPRNLAEPPVQPISTGTDREKGSAPMNP